MKKRRTSIFVVLSLFWFAVLNGQPSLFVDNLFFQDSLAQWYDCSRFIEFQQDLSADLSIQEVAALEEGWRTLPITGNVSWTKNCWLKLALRNQRTAPAELVLLLHSDDLTAWLQNENGNWESLLGGSLRPRSEWNSRRRSPVFSSPHTLQFEVPESGVQTIYLKLGPPDQNFKVKPRLCNRSFFLTHSTWYFNRTIATQSFFHGVLWVTLLFHFLMFLMNRDRAYLYYAVYILFLSLFLFYSFEFYHLTFLAEFPRLSRLLIIASVYGFSIFYALFLTEFLHAENWRKDVKKRFIRYIKLIALIGAISLALLLLPPSIFKLLYANWILAPVSVTSLLGLLYISFQYWQSDNQLARYIAGTNFFMLCGLTVSALVYYAGALNWVNLRSSAYWGILFLELSVIFQLLSFSLSLSYKGLETERERTRLKELDQLKSRFFANISHEFRTPLTLILGPLRQLKATINQPTNRRRLQTAEIYAQKLLRMVDQILDLTKLEAGKLQLRPKVFDIVKLVKVIVSSFQSIAQDYAIDLSFKSEKEEWKVWLDQDKIEQILINLIGNAIKYNKKGGEASVHLDIIQGKTLKIQVKDTGIGIPEDALPYIFQLYYQGKHKDFVNRQSSSGVGLAFTKELLELQNGKISLESKEGLGSTFTIEIPLPAIDGKAAGSGDLLNEVFLEKPRRFDADEQTEDDEKAIVLVVEDHKDIQAYIRSCLLDQYQLLFADDGEMGVAIARKQVPDLIITDVMMPKMDGFALTRALKNDALTSHIPIVILTGKSSKASRLEGLKNQADEYLAKPFDAEELRLRLQNLLDNRQKWIAHFQQQSGAPPQRDQPKSLEDVFLEKVEKVVQENLTDENFNVERLSRILRLDRTQLFRKLKALTGQNPSHFIRVVRLQAAYRLLQSRSATVAEIAFEVGFSNTSYFSRSFKTHFGKTPGEVMKEG